jgi:hypothetical protein
VVGTYEHIIDESAKPIPEMPDLTFLYTQGAIRVPLRLKEATICLTCPPVLKRIRRLKWGLRVGRIVRGHRDEILILLSRGGCATNLFEQVQVARILT